MAISTDIINWGPLNTGGFDGVEEIEDNLNNTFLEACFNKNDLSMIDISTNNDERANGKYLFVMDENELLSMPVEYRKSIDSDYVKTSMTALKENRFRYDSYIVYPVKDVVSLYSCIDENGELQSNRPIENYSTIGIRPAMWVKLPEYGK